MPTGIGGMRQNRRSPRHCGSMRMQTPTPTLIYWPDDDDGDALRQLASIGFDFDAAHRIDFHVDFERWPPSREFIARLGEQYPDLSMVEPGEDDSGYLIVTIDDRLSYQRLQAVQQQVSALAAPYGGWCRSWGVPHERGDDPES